MTGAHPPLVLVRGVVYKLMNRSHLPLSRPNFEYIRMSVPPDAMPSKRSRWPYSYTTHRLPAHEVIDQATATAVIDSAMARWRTVLAENIQ